MSHTEHGSGKLVNVVELVRYGNLGLVAKVVYGKGAVVSWDKGIKDFFFTFIGGNFRFKKFTSLIKFLIFLAGLV